MNVWDDCQEIAENWHTTANINISELALKDGLIQIKSLSPPNFTTAESHG